MKVYYVRFPFQCQTYVDMSIRRQLIKIKRRDMANHGSRVASFSFLRIYIVPLRLTQKISIGNFLRLHSQILYNSDENVMSYRVIIPLLYELYFEDSGGFLVH